jgi:Mrp family chromosome partitioning ATPase
MDAIIRNIDPARLERERRPDSDSGGIHASVPPTGTTGFSDTFLFMHRMITLDEAQRERERILPPGATGPTGGPYKLLRTQVLQRLSQLSANSVAVLSASSGEGKTLTAINLAIAVAADIGHTALLVDLDLRHPSIARRLGFQPTTGIEDCLQGRRPVFEPMVKIEGYERLTVLPARAGIGQSSELLATQRTAELMQELRARYHNRVIIFDLPPVLEADDALTFSRQVQCGLFVVAEGRSEREAITRSLALLEKLPIIGTVLNRSQCAY